MVTHPWYVLHIPGTNSYVPIWTIAILLALPFVAVIAVALVARLGCARRENDNSR